MEGEDRVNWCLLNSCRSEQELKHSAKHADLGEYLQKERGWSPRLVQLGMGTARTLHGFIEDE